MAIIIQALLGDDGQAFLAEIDYCGQKITAHVAHDGSRPELQKSLQVEIGYARVLHVKVIKHWEAEYSGIFPSGANHTLRGVVHQIVEGEGTQYYDVYLERSADFACFDAGDFPQSAAISVGTAVEVEVEGLAFAIWSSTAD